MSQLCQIEDVKTYLGISTTSTDGVITALIPQASAMIENYCNRTFAQASYSETRNGNNAASIFVRQLPIVSVQSVSVNGISVTAAPDTQSYGYVFDDERIYIRGSGSRQPMPLGVYPGGCPDCFLRGVQNIVLAYTAGYSTIPSDLAQACIELVGWKMAKRDRLDKRNETLGSQQTQGYDLSDMPASVKTAIKPYRMTMIPP